MDDDPYFSIETTNSFNIKNSYLIVGFPSNVPDAAVAVELFDMAILKFNEIARLRSRVLPNHDVAIDDKRVYHSRILLAERRNLVIISSYMRPKESDYKQLAKIILDFAREHDIKYVFTCGMVSTDADVGTVRLGNTDNAKSIVTGATLSRAEILQRIDDAKIKVKIMTQALPDERGTVTGFPAMLINQGIENKQDVIAILNGQNSKFERKPATQLCIGLLATMAHIDKSPTITSDYDDLDECVDIYQPEVERRIEKFNSLNK